jgi:hypothetical protein
LIIISYHDIIFLDDLGGEYMPAVSFYLSKDDLEAVRAKAKSENVSASKIISRAVNTYVKSEEERAAKKRILNLVENGELKGILGRWEEIHKERTEADVCRA